MSLRKVPRGEWAGALDRFCREHPASLANVLDVHGDVEAVRVEERPLRSIDVGNSMVAIAFADDTPDLRVDGARVLRMDDHGLAIESPQGTMRLRLRHSGSTGSPGAGS
jgi:hypothetical protein